MSEYIKARTMFKAAHLDCLAKALEDVEPTWKGKVEIHAGQGDLLVTYLARDRGTPQRANVIVRRALVGGASNDVGFAARSDGSVEAVIGDFDQGAGAYKHRAAEARCNAAWMGRLAQAYAYRVAEKQAGAIGARISKEVRQDGSWRVAITPQRQKALY